MLPHATLAVCFDSLLLLWHVSMKCHWSLCEQEFHDMKSSQKAACAMLLHENRSKGFDMASANIFMWKHVLFAP